MTKDSEMIGKKFGRLTIVARAGSEKHNGFSRKLWECVCECGNHIVLHTKKLTSGNTRSCGCLLKEYNTSKKPDPQEKRIRRHIQNVWSKIKERCYNPKSNNYRAYGARGIRVCEEWLHDSKAFAKWCLSNGYQIGLEIDRIDNNGNYEPSNCQFLTKRENILKEVKRITIAGIPLRYSEYSNILGFRNAYFTERIRRVGFTKAYIQSFHKLIFNIA